MAAASAALDAELGHRTLVVSTDIAHSLGDALGMELGAEPTPVADRLDAQEINVDAVSVRPVDLDDVFLSLTGHPGSQEVSR